MACPQGGWSNEPGEARSPLGGCTVEWSSPDWLCRACDHRWADGTIRGRHLESGGPWGLIDYAVSLGSSEEAAAAKAEANQAAIGWVTAQVGIAIRLDLNVYPVAGTGAPKSHSEGSLLVGLPPTPTPRRTPAPTPVRQPRTPAPTTTVAPSVCGRAIRLRQVEHRATDLGPRWIRRNPSSRRRVDADSVTNDDAALGSHFDHRES